ncbi:MAG: DUF6531 domain-containing protein [Nitrososphaera sp.]|nr:DUF6531 domain-containing protein [Nitrososphaera sp.]
MGNNPNNLTITIPSGKPTANPDTLSNSPKPGTSVQFYGNSSRSSGSCSKIVEYSWNFADGTTSASMNPTHIFQPENGSTTYYVSLTVTDANGETDQETLPIYVSCQSLGTATESSFSPDPVNLATGNYIYQHSDLRLPGKGFPFEFSRFYNSKFSDQSGLPCGFGWTHSYNVHLSTTATDATVTFGDSHSETHILLNGQYVAETGIYDILTKNPNGSFALTSKDQSSKNFDDQGRLTSIVDKNGNTLSLAYSNGILTSITDTAGRQIAFQSNAGGLITQITDPFGRMIQFQYDGETNLVAAIDANGGSNGYSYDANHQMTAAFDPRGTKFLQNTYDELQRVVSYQEDAYLSSTGFLYDFINHITYVTNALGGISIHRHDERLLITNIVNELGNAESYSYDLNRNRTRVIDRNGNETTFDYDVRGNVTKKVDALGNETRIEYDFKNNPTRRVDALGNETTFGYDTAGNLMSTTNALNLVSTVGYDSAGLPVLVTDANQQVTTSFFDSQGNLTNVVGSCCATRSFFYDVIGRKIMQIDGNGHTNHFGYDSNDNVVFTVDGMGHTIQHFFDASDNLFASIDPRGATTTNFFDLKDRLAGVRNALGGTSSNRFDALDRKVETTDARGNKTYFAFDSIGNLVAITNALGQVTKFSYDPNGNQTNITNPLGHVVSNFFDPLNRLVRVTDPNGGTESYVYDALNRRIAVTDSIGQVTQFAYDALGRLTNAIDAAGGVIQYSYDNVGNRLTVTDPKGNTTINHYDALNRLVRQDDPVGGISHFEYDGVGNLTRKIDAKGQTVDYLYDSNSRLINVAYPTGPPVTFTWDAVGNRTNMTDGLGTTTWDYDLLNRLTRTADAYGKEVLHGYDDNGNRTSLTYPGNKLVIYSYDTLNRLISVSNWLNHETHYDYDSAGNLIGAANFNGTSSTYVYDPAHRLVQMTNVGPASALISSYALTLDAVGNLQQSVQDEPLLPVIPNEAIDYTYDADNRLTAINGVPLGYDNNGNITSKGADSFSYDFENRLVESVTGGIATQYSYDGLGSRLSFTRDGVTRRFVLDRSASLTQLLAETDTGGNITAYYIYGLGLLSRVAADGTEATYHYDVRGSTIALSDVAGALSDSYTYTTFGKIADIDGSSPQPFRYLGRYGILDEGNDLSYARARYFSPTLGRFLTKDPLLGTDGDSQSLNRYVYALNNPLLFHDVSGLSPQEWQGFARHISIGDFLINGSFEVTERIGEYLLKLKPGDQGYQHFEALTRRGYAVDFRGLGFTLQIVGRTLIVYSIVSDTASELSSQGITLTTLVDSYRNIGANVAFGLNNGDALLDAATKGVTSVTAFTLRVLTLGLLNVHGEDVESFVTPKFVY